MNATPPDKEAVVLSLLEEGDTMLCLDARYAGVQVPRAHCQNPNLRLILNLNFPHPIEVTAAGIRANLAFGGRRFACYVPMGALWGVFNPHTMHGMMWPDSMPPEVLAEIAAHQEQAGDSTTKPRANPLPPRQRGHLRVIK